MEEPWARTLVSVDLDTESVTTIPIPDGWVPQYVGGKGLGARYLYDAVDAGTDPFDSTNPLLFLVGPLTGYLPGGGRCAVITKSPLTELFLDSYVGGSLGPSIRAAYPESAGMVITGSTDTLSVIDLRGPPTITPAAELTEATNDVVDETYPDALVASIGPGGEHGVRYATIATHGGDHHAGRGGAGAVLGSKGIKAVLLPETPEIEPPTDALRKLQTDAAQVLEDSAYGHAYASTGTLETVDIADTAGMLPTEGWQSRRFRGSDAIGVSAVQKAAIGRESESTPKGDYRVRTADDYETVIRGGTPIALGSGLGIDDFDAVSLLGATCDRLGLDVISAGNAVAVAIVASQRGELERALTFGDSEAILGLLEEIATGSTPLGRVLGQGVEAAADHLGIADVIPSVKAMAVPSFDARGVPAMALAFATSDRGACHRRAIPATVSAFDARWTPTQLSNTLATEQNRRSLLWSLIVDDRTAPVFPDLGTRWLNALGAAYRPADLEHIGERIWTLTRLINVREGVSRSDDSLPEVFTQPTTDGAAGLEPSRFSMALDRYYERRDWDRDGRPSQRLLERLDLDNVVDDATPIGGHPLHAD